MELLGFSMHRSCPKCNAFSAGITIKYKAKWGRLPEHLEKKCDTCGYSWREKPSDTRQD